MRLIVGLGNPGSEYARTRHNAGFMVLDRLAQRHGLADDKPKLKFHAECREGRVLDHRVALLKPMTYMNRSGLTVGEARSFYKLDPDDILIVVDETALPVGRIRIRPSGSAGGHNGLSDIELSLGTRAYPRLRVGVDEPPQRVAKKDYVLGRFTPDQVLRMESTLDRACDCIECWLGDDIDAVMARYNSPE